MIGVIATIRTKEGTGADFEKAFGDLASAVHANEKGTLFYQLTRSRTEPGVYKVLELYKDADAQQAHRDAVHFKELGARLGPYMAGRAEVEVLDAV